MWILCSVWKLIFPSIRRSFQRLHKVNLNDISYHINIILLNRRENMWFFLIYAKFSKRGSTNRVFVIRTCIDFLISTFLSNSHSKFPTICTIFFNSQLHLTIPFCIFNSLILQYLPHVTHFPQTVPTLPFIRPFVRLLRHILHQHLFLIQPMV
jgi:hypothetical protein